MNSSLLPPESIAIADVSPTNYYRTLWHYRTRSHWDNYACAVFHVDVSAGSPKDAFTKAALLADIEFRRDPLRFTGSLDFDRIVAGTVDDFEAADRACRRNYRLLTLGIPLGVAALLGYLGYLAFPFGMWLP